MYQGERTPGSLKWKKKSELSRPTTSNQLRLGGIFTYLSL